MALDRRNYKALVETTVALGNKVRQGGAGEGLGGCVRGCMRARVRLGLCAGVQTCPGPASTTLEYV